MNFFNFFNEFLFELVNLDHNYIKNVIKKKKKKEKKEKTKKKMKKKKKSSWDSNPASPMYKKNDPNATTRLLPIC